MSDFEYEFQMAGMNARLNPDIETVFLMASDRFQFISSRFVKEIGALGGDVSHFVSPRVAARLLDRFAGNRDKPRRRRLARSRCPTRPPALSEPLRHSPQQRSAGVRASSPDAGGCHRCRARERGGPENLDRGISGFSA